ncbi:hypothetical protein V8G54_019059 [Vigna mungo]|uniref:Uncharacterized protein n=1 Tax=Vigna mungo TaxID=3915 RepID=A0AAQ3NBY1_VIGMU
MIPIYKSTRICKEPNRLINFFDLGTSTTRRRCRNIFIHASRNVGSTGTLVHLRNYWVADALQLLHLVFELICFGKLVAVQPMNSTLNSIFNLLFIIGRKLGSNFLILNSVPHVVGIIFQCILCIDLLLVLLILCLVLLCLLDHLLNILL